MKLVKNLRWAVLASSILSGSALAAAITCNVTPKNSVITEGQTLQLAATCNGVLSSINWLMDGMTVTNDVALSGHAASDPVHYTTPVGLGGSNTFVFSVTGTPFSSADAFGTTSTATVVVKPASAVVAKAAGSTAPTSPVPAACGGANGTAVSTMPTNGEQCNSSVGKPALAISGPTSFTWSCVSLTGGLEANCSAVRGFTVTATAGVNGTVNLSSQGVSSGASATIIAAPGEGYSAAFTSGCGGTQSGNSFITGPVTANCAVTASFTNTPTAASCGSANNVATLTSPSTNLCGAGALLGTVADGTGKFTWTCDGPNGGTDAICQAPKQYTVTATLSGTGGTVNTPTSKTVTHNATTSFAVTPDGTNVASVSGCGASASGNTVTTGAVTGACDVTVSFGPPVTGISCNGVTMPGTVTEISTTLPIGGYPRTTFSSAPEDTVYSFKVTVPTGAAQDYFAAKVIKTTSAPSTRYMVISSCRGDYITAGKPTGCYKMPSEVTTATAVVNYTTTVAPESKYCHMQPGQTYWVNLSTRNSATGSPMCSSPTECGFYFEAN